MARQPIINLGQDNTDLVFDRPTAVQIFGFVRDAIVTMNLLPGQMISETALAKQFGVSRTPVREALIQLSSIGFVEVLPQRGTFVTKFSMNKILEARFIREAVEVAVVSFLAGKNVEDVVTQGEKIIAQQKEAAADKDALSFQQLDDDFHQLLAAQTHYARVGQLIEAEKAHMDRVRALSLRHEDQFSRILAQHSAIITGIASGSPEKAAQAMSIHLKDVYNLLKTIPQEHPEYFI